MKADAGNKRLLSSADNSVSLPPPLAVFIAQHLPAPNANSTAAVQWTPITVTSTCTFRDSRASQCNVQFRDVQRVDSSQPAVLVVAIQKPDVVLEGVTVRRQGAGGSCNKNDETAGEETA